MSVATWWWGFLSLTVNLAFDAQPNAISDSIRVST